MHYFGIAVVELSRMTTYGGYRAGVFAGALTY